MKEIIIKAVIEILNLRVLYIAYIVSVKSKVIFSQEKGINIEGTAINSFCRSYTNNYVCIDCHGLDAVFQYKYFHASKYRAESPML
jgi:hypothetical protein